MNYYKYWHQLKFQVLRDIKGLPLYTGIHWSAFFRIQFRQYTALSMPELEFCVIPLANRIDINPGDFLTVNIATNEQGEDIFKKWVLNKEKSVEIEAEKCHFIIDKTIRLVDYSSFEFKPELHKQIIADEVTRLTLIFATPLRLKRTVKTDGRFFDPFHFDFKEFIERLSRLQDVPVPDIEGISLSDKSFFWLDIAYKKTIGGIIGGITIKGKFSQEILQLLHFGQFCGLGKNRCLGFGFYYIEEYPHPFLTNVDGKNGLFSFSSLMTKLQEMTDNNEPGSDMTAKDLLEHPEYLRQMSAQIYQMSYRPGLPENSKTKNGGFITTAYLQKDKLILALLTDHIAKLFAQLISSNCYSYHKGYSYHQAQAKLKKELDKGFSWGIKQSIDSFLDSVSHAKLLLILKSLSVEPVIIYLIDIYYKIDYLQDNTLSPLLSNLAMLAFDRWFRNQKQLKLIRSADDMVIIGRDIEKQIVMEKISFMLQQLGLKLNNDKTQEFSQTSSLNFLEYTISKTEIIDHSE